MLSQDRAAAIDQAAATVAPTSTDAEFPIDVFQTGSGTSSNMNANEVIGALASELLGRDGPPERPCERVAVEQRRFPTSIHVAATAGVVQQLVPALEISETLERKASEFAEVVKIAGVPT